jgi:choline monooxygenase
MHRDLPLNAPNDRVRRFIGQFDPAIELAAASTAPASWYVDRDFYEHEAAAVLKRAWQPVAPLAKFKEPGSFHSGEFLGEPYVIVRGDDGNLRAFFNVCRHHAAGVAEGEGRAKLFMCPYHGWTYSLRGELIRTPSLGEVKNFCKEKMGLVPIALKVVGPFVFLNFSTNPEPFPQEWMPLFEKLEATGYGELEFVRRREYEIKCNWKVYVDNYLDGGYHVKILHKGLASQLDLDGYKIENFDRWTLQSCGGSTKEKTESKGDGARDFRERIGDSALYAWLYPNYMINRYGNIMDVNWVLPLGPDRCLTIFDYYFAKGSDPQFIEDSLKASDRVQLEDVAISESVQKGLSSSAYHAGRYSAELESGMHLFHRWLHADLSR